MSNQNDDTKRRMWFVMRDLKRVNAKQPAYMLLEEKGITAFTPKKWRVTMRGGEKIRNLVPFISDLLFVNSTREELDPIVEKTPTLQYRWLRNTFRKPMTVSDAEMERFIFAVTSTESGRYYCPDEITADMRNRRIRIIGGTLNGYEGTLVTTRGSKTKRILVELPSLLAVAVEVNPEFIQLL